MSHQIDCLDHGYVKLIDEWGSDQMFIEAARMSTQKGFRGWGPKKVPVPLESGDVIYKSKPGDEKLLRYLYENKHFTPFEMGGLHLEVKAPIFVFRQWHRHRTQSVNEMSARYVPLPADDYVPTVERMMADGGKNKQAGAKRGAKNLSKDDATELQAMMSTFFEDAERLYRQMLEEGVPKELARLVLPVARYSVMRVSANLRNWLAFMTLRCDAHAQEEIRVYGEAVSHFVEAVFPRTHELWSEGQS